jgi:hypothetical protein
MQRSLAKLEKKGLAVSGEKSRIVLKKGGQQSTGAECASGFVPTN